MKKDQRFFVCQHCGNMVAVIKDSGVPMVCCGEPMKELKANTVEASTEKHIPAVTVEGNELTARIGSVEHPMVEEHSILWIYVQTEAGGQRKDLHPGEAPEAKFVLADDKAIAVYAYCNIHGLWKVDVK